MDCEKLFMTDSSFIANRIMYSVIPLDTTDKILLAITLPMTDMTDLIASFFSRAALTFLTTLLICSLLFYRQINKITKPVENILSATRAIADGNLDCRLQVVQAGEFKPLVHAFNNMMTSLSTVYADRIRQERELTIAQEDLRYKDLLEKKNREIENYNKELAEHNKELSVLLQITQEMSSTLDLDTLFANMLNSLRNMIGCQTLILLTYDSGSALLEVSQTLGIDREALADVTFKLTEGISGESARTKKTIYAPDLKIEKRYLSYKKTLTVFGSMLSIPLITHDRLCGVLNLHKDKIKLQRRGESFVRGRCLSGGDRD
ncbi:MAG: HAMP domain-containing protein [Desulfuromonadales bacterium]|nr:HAMP domain-containing protein [Desulfuromonadales bacterium]